MKTTPLRRVALLIEASRGYGRGLLRGIARYARTHDHWSVFYQECRLGDLPSWLPDWKGDGIIARIESRAMAQSILRKGLPVVDVRNLLPDLGVPVADTDNRAIVQLAVEVFLRRGFRRVAFCGFKGANYSDTRESHLIEAATEHKLECNVYRPMQPVFQPSSSSSSKTFEYEQHGLVYEQDLEEWLRQLPHPIALLACNDIRGQQVLNACRRLGITVPDDIAVLGVDDDQIVCELATPPLSSIDPNPAGVGYEAARLLDTMMDGQPPPPTPILVPPARCVERRSTDVLAVEDPAVAKALRFIRHHGLEPISVEEVTRQAGLSRRVLERRFRRIVGRSPKAEIIRVCLERVRTLLWQTELPIAQVAAKVGFEHLEHFHVLFKKHVGMTPGQYRANAARS